MPKIILADTSTLILLKNIDFLDLLEKLYQEVSITEDIQKEFGESLPEWINIVQYENQTFYEELTQDLGKGESSAITFASENTNTLLILDDLKARKVAEVLGLEITGILGILLLAKQKQVIKTVKPYLEMLKKVNFRISKKLEEHIVNLAQEK